MQESSVQKAQACVYRLLKIRLRSEQEIRDRLVRKTYSSECVERVIRYFKDLGLIDDYEFSCQWASCRFERLYGIRRIKHELLQKGVAPAIIDTVLAQQYDAQKETNVVRALITKRLRRYPVDDLSKSQRRIYAHLQRRGFNINTINRVFNQYDW